MTPDRRTLLALFAIALGLRLLYAAVISTDPSINSNPTTFEFLNARTVASGAQWISKPYSPWAPGFSMLLGAAFAVLGDRFWVVWLLQAGLGAITVLVVYRFGERLLGKFVGLISALWLGLYVNHIQYASMAGRDVLAALLFLATIYLLAQPFHKMRTAVWTGLFYTLLIHTHPFYLLLAPAIVIYLFFAATRHRLLNLQYVFVFLIAAFVFSLPWTVRNYVVYHEFVPVGLESKRYVGGLIDWISGDTWEPALPSTEIVKARPLPGPSSNAKEFWRVARFRHGQGRAWSVRHNIISIMSYGLLLPLFLYGIYVALRKRNRRGLVLAGAVILYFLMSIKYGGSERTRLPVEPLIILLAFYGLSNLIGILRARRGATS